MLVWLTGARGLLGHAITAHCERAQAPLVATGHELDIADAGAVEAFIRRERPTHVVNCAADARVDDAETDEEEAVRANATCPAVLARAAREARAVLVHFSTDYVFDGAASQPYAEDAPVAPLNAYGRTKLAGERAVLAELPHGLSAFVIRTSLLFGEGGDHFVARILRKLEETAEIRVVDDQRSRPTYAPDLAEAALELAGVATLTPAPGETARVATPGVYHFANAGAVSRFELALAVRDSALARGRAVRAPGIVPVSLAELGQPAERPRYSALDTSRFEHFLGRRARPFREALDEYLGLPPG